MNQTEEADIMGEAFISRIDKRFIPFSVSLGPLRKMALIESDVPDACECDSVFE